MGRIAAIAALAALPGGCATVAVAPPAEDCAVLAAAIEAAAPEVRAQGDRIAFPRRLSASTYGRPFADEADGVRPGARIDLRACPGLPERIGAAGWTLVERPFAPRRAGQTMADHFSRIAVAGDARVVTLYLAEGEGVDVFLRRAEAAGWRADEADYWLVINAD